MDEQTLMAFIQRIIRNTSSDIQAQSMLRELHGMLEANARQHPGEKDLLAPLTDAIAAFPEVREDAAKAGELDRKAIAIAKKRADERREREAQYNRC